MFLAFTYHEYEECIACSSTYEWKSEKKSRAWVNTVKTDSLEKGVNV